MKITEILSKCDHTLLAQGATWAEIKAVCDDGIKYGTASVCIPASYVKQAKEYVGDKLQICTVIGFPNGYSTTEVKVFECKDALANGADEIDTVINIGHLKDRRYDEILNELKALKEACGEKILKVIIETCLLTDDEKIKMCEIVTASGADFIKTSTGFSTAGATREDVALFAKHIGEGVQIKAAGGISSLADAEDFINLGATRLGTSRIVKIANCTADAVKSKNGSEIFGGDALTVHKEGHVFSCMIGAIIRRVASVVCRNDKNVLIGEAGKIFAKPSIESVQSFCISYRILTVSVLHIKINKIYKAKSVEIFVDYLSGLYHTLSIIMCRIGFGNSRHSEYITYLTNSDNVKSGFGKRVEHRVLGGNERKVAAVLAALEIGIRTNKGTRDNTSNAVLTTKHFARGAADLI